MPVFPSGKRRIMEAQQSPNETGTGLNLEDNSVSEFRSRPQQQEIVDNGPGNVQEMPEQSNPQPAASAQPNLPGTNVPNQQEVTSDDVSTTSEDNIKTAVFQILQELGVPPRQLKENAAKIIEVTHDLDTNLVNGHYLIPTYTQGHEITEAKAKQIAAQIGKRFNLSQSLKAGDINYRVDFRSNAAQNTMGHGTSFDNLGGGQSNRKAASTTPSIHDMIKFSKERLVKTLKGKKDSQ